MRISYLARRIIIKGDGDTETINLSYISWEETRDDDTSIIKDVRITGFVKELPGVEYRDTICLERDIFGNLHLIKMF